MTRISKLDKAALIALRSPIEAELKALGERLGLSFALGNGTFGEGAEASFKLVIKVDDPAVKIAAAKAEWDRNCTYIGIDFANPATTGLRPEDFGTEFVYNQTRMKTTGLALKGRGSQKFPIIVEILADGRGLKAGDIRMLPEAAVPIIRAATDAAKPAAPAKAEPKRAKAA
jgi:hypothetical protein